MNNNKATKGEVTETKEALNEALEKRLERLENELIQEIKEKIAILKKELAYSDLTVAEETSTSWEKSIFDTIKVSKGVVILGFADKKMTVENLVIPEKIGGDKVIRIEDNAFASTKCIKRVELPTCLEAIGEKAFYNCSGLKHVLIPKSVKQIGWAAFDGISNEARIYCEAEKRPQGWQSDWYAWNDERVRWGM